MKFLKKLVVIGLDDYQGIYVIYWSRTKKHLNTQVLNH